MISSEDAIPNPKAQNLATWTSYRLNNFDSASSHLFVLVGHHAIIIPQRYHNDKGYKDSFYDQEEKMMVVDLADYKIQKIEIPPDMICHPDFECTLINYKENQVLKVEGDEENVIFIWQITFESFDPLAVKCEYIRSNTGPGPALCKHSIEIYEDFLYVYGEKERSLEENELWKFDLKTGIWTECKLKGQSPGSRSRPCSFIFQDNFYVYGGSEKKNQQAINPKEIFVLNLNSLTWSKLEQELDSFTKRHEINLTSHIYKGHLILLGDGTESKETLYCWDIRKNIWSTFQVGNIGLKTRYGRLFIYKNLLLAFGIHGGLCIAILNLENIDWPNIETSETKHLRSIFMVEEGSDLMFKIEEKIIPAHKEVLIQKSKYFANLFESGMADSMQKIIEIKDCDYPVFQEYLRYLYYDEIQQLDAHLAIKLLSYSDKYLQEDLYEKCMCFLTYNISMENVYTILNFSRQEKFAPLQCWCLKFLRNNLTVDDISALIRYLGQQQQQLSNEEFVKENTELRDKAMYFVMENYAKISQKEPNFKLYEDFLKENLRPNTNGVIAKFIYNQDLKGEAKKVFQKDTANLKETLYDFVKKNFLELKKKHVTKKFPEPFWEDLVSCLAEKLCKVEKKLASKKEKENKPQVAVEQPQRKRKRKESAKNPKKDELKEELDVKKAKVLSLVEKLCKGGKKKIHSTQEKESKKIRSTQEKENKPPAEQSQKSRKRKESGKKKDEPEEPEAKPELKKTKKTQTKKEKLSFL